MPSRDVSKPAQVEGTQGFAGALSLGRPGDKTHTFYLFIYFLAIGKLTGKTLVTK